MAAAVRTSAAGGSSSGTGNRTATITPAVNDLFVVYCCVAANTNDTPTCSDDNGGSYDLIDVMNFAIAAVNYRMSVFVRTALLANTTSTTVTVATGSNTSGAVHVLAITGVTRVGADAVRSKGSQNNQAAGTGAPTLNQSALTNNPTLAAIGSADTTTTAPTNWTEIQDTNFSNDTVALEEAFRASGFTGTTITFGAAQSTQFCTHAMELDTTVLLTQSPSDNVNNLADTSQLGYGNLHADSVANLADSATIIIGHALSFSESVNNLADGSVRIIGILSTAQDSLQALTDALAQLLTYQLALTDSEAANWADAHNLLLSQFLALTDFYTLTDASILQVEQRVQSSDALNTLSDVLVQQIGVVLELSDDTNSLDDSFELLLAYRLALADINQPDFPATSILDDFNRPNEGPPPSASWTLGFAVELEGTTEPGHRVVSNQMANVGSDINQNWYNAAQFGPDCEAYITVTNSGSVNALGLAARLTDISGFSSNGYYIQANPGGFAGADRAYQIIRIDNGAITSLASDIELGVGSMTGDKYGIRCVGDSIQLWADTGEGWKLRLSAIDSTYQTSGHLGVLTDSTSSSVSRWDDFGGGTINSGLADSFAQVLATGPDLFLDFSDTISLSDSLALGHGLGLADSGATLTDALNLQAGKLLAAADSFLLTDSETHVVELLLTFAETISLADSLSSGHGLACADSFTLADALVLRLDHLISTDDSLSLVDSEAHLLSHLITATDDLNLLGDSVARQVGYEVDLIDLLSPLTDSRTLELSYQLSFSDTVTLTDHYFDDLINTVVGTTEECADDINLLVDGLVIGIGIVLSDNAASLADTESHTLGYLLACTDLVAALDDSILLRLHQSLDFNDSIALSDSEFAVLGQGQSLTDTLTILSDEEVNQLDQRLSFAESINNLADDIALTLARLLDLSDQLTLTDSTQLGYGLLFTDDANSLLDSVLTSAPQGPLRQVGVTDSVDNLTDSVALRLDYLLAVADATSLNDSLALNEGLLTAFSDSLAITDSADSALGHLVPLVDSLALNDSAQLRLGYELAVGDVVTLTDTTTQSLSYLLTLTDNASLLADSTTKSLGLGVIISDNAPTLTDAISLFSAWLLQFSDSLTLSDSLARFSTAFLTLVDSLTITDSVTIELRGPDLDEAVADTLAFTDSIALTLGNELQLQVVISDTITLTDHYFDLRHPYTPSTKRHIVVPSRARVTVPTRRREVIVPASDRTTRVE